MVNKAHEAFGSNAFGKRIEFDDEQIDEEGGFWIHIGSIIVDLFKSFESTEYIAFVNIYQYIVPIVCTRAAGGDAVYCDCDTAKTAKLRFILRCTAMYCYCADDANRRRGHWFTLI